jgi:hypothetical protein
MNFEPISIPAPEEFARKYSIPSPDEHYSNGSLGYNPLLRKDTYSTYSLKPIEYNLDKHNI